MSALHSCSLTSWNQTCLLFTRFHSVCTLKTCSVMFSQDAHKFSKCLKRCLMFSTSQVALTAAVVPLSFLHADLIFFWPFYSCSLNKATHHPYGKHTTQHHNCTSHASKPSLSKSVFTEHTNSGSSLENLSLALSS